MNPGQLRIQVFVTEEQFYLNLMIETSLRWAERLEVN